MVDKLFIEAKTKMNPSQSITVKKGWIDKAKEQSLAMRKEDYAIAVSFGDPKEYYLIEDVYKRQPVGRIIELVGLPQSGKTTTALDIISNFQKKYTDKYLSLIHI